VKEFFAEWSGILLLVNLLVTIFIAYRMVFEKTSPVRQVFLWSVTCAIAAYATYATFCLDSVLWWILVFMFPIELCFYAVDLIQLFLFLGMKKMKLGKYNG
jgi:fluoride ion exporter CrcB/FEX